VALIPSVSFNATNVSSGNSTGSVANVLNKTNSSGINATIGEGSEVPAIFSLSLLPDLIVPVRVVRSNWPVRWPAQANVITIFEFSPPGTVVSLLSPVDNDTTQSFSFEIVSSNATLGVELFAINTTGVQRTVSVEDLGRGGSMYTRKITRTSTLFVALDALDATAGDTTIALVLRVTDDGFFNNSRLAQAVPTFSDLRLKVIVAPRGLRPVIASVAHVPEAGLSVTGGDLLEIKGSWLGLPFGTASFVSASLVTVDGTMQLWPFPSCMVVERLVRLRCVSPPGYGAALNLSVTVSGKTDRRWHTGTCISASRSELYFFEYDLWYSDGGITSQQWPGVRFSWRRIEQSVNRQCDDRHSS